MAPNMPAATVTPNISMVWPIENIGKGISGHMYCARLYHTLGN